MRHRRSTGFSMDELIAFLDGRKYLRSVSDAAIGRACGGGEIVHTGGDYWRVKEQPGVAGDEEEAEPPSDERPYGRTHFTCSYCVTAPPKEHDCTTCQTCLSTERQRVARKDRDAREAAEGRYATEEYDPAGKGSSSG